jgi:hypothetical protein
MPNREMTKTEFLAERQAAPEPRPYEPDWLVHSVERTDDRSYPYRVVGENLNFEVGEPMRKFIWNVPRLSWRYFWP